MACTCWVLLWASATNRLPQFASPIVLHIFFSIAVVVVLSWRSFTRPLCHPLSPSQHRGRRPWTGRRRSPIMSLRRYNNKTWININYIFMACRAGVVSGWVDGKVAAGCTNGCRMQRNGIECNELAAFPVLYHSTGL